MTDDYFMDKGWCFVTFNQIYLVLSFLLSIVFKALDKDTDGALSPEEWIKGLSIFLRGTLEEKIECKLKLV